MNTVKKIINLLLAGGMVMFLFGCDTKKYNVDYDGSKNLYSGAQDSYKAGELVVLKYDLIATDTSYSFYLDGEEIDYSYDGGVITLSFLMPDHDAKLTVCSRNTMVNDNRVLNIQNDVAIGDIWIMEDNTENHKTTLWGTATLSKDSYQLSDTVPVTIAGEYEAYIIRMIDEDGFYYSVSGVILKDADRITITAGEYPMTAFLETFDAEGNSLGQYDMEIHRL